MSTLEKSICLKCKKHREGHDHDFYFAHSWSAGPSGAMSYSWASGYDSIGREFGFICNKCAIRELFLTIFRNIMFLAGYIVLWSIVLRYYGKINADFVRLLEIYIVLSIAFIFLQHRMKNFFAFIALVLQPIGAVILYISLYFESFQHNAILVLCGIFGLYGLAAGGFSILMVLMGNDYEDADEDMFEKAGRNLAFRCIYPEIVRREKNLHYFINLDCWSTNEYNNRIKDDGA